MAKFHTVAVATLLSSLLCPTAAAPALVWNSSSSISESVYISQQVASSSLFQDVTTNIASNDDLALVFVLQRASNGDENLSALAGSGALPSISNIAGTTVYSHVDGIEGPRSVLRDLSNDAVMIDMSALDGKLTGEIPAVAGRKKKAARRKLLEANKVIINVDNSVDVSELDAVVANAIQNEKVKSVVLTAARSAKETKDAKILKKMIAKKNRKVAKNAPRRRLEQDNNGNNQGNNGDNEAVYYVYMTPNILAGLLFTLLFTFITFTGISCMGMIQGQDVFVSKMPVVGREA